MTGSIRRSGNRRAQDAPSDEGVTLIEVLVGMGIMSVVMAMVTSGVLVLQRTDRLVVALTEAQAELGRVFLRLDREVRYAADLRTEQLAGSGSPYPSLLWLSTVDGARCSAMSLVGDRLLLQQWTPGAVPGAAAVLASGVSAVDGVAPFAVTGGGATDPSGNRKAEPKEATIVITASTGTSAQSSRRALRETIVARNSLRGPDGTSLDECTP